MVNFKQGEDLILEVQVIDKNNEKLSMTTATSVRVALVIRNYVYQKYMDILKESPIAGYGTSNVNITDDTKIDVVITREQSRNFSTGDVSLNILVEFPDVDLDGKAIEYETVVANVSKGYLKDEEII